MPFFYIAIIIFSVCYPRFSVLGGLPGTDEGFYAFQAQSAYKSIVVQGSLPPEGPLMIYPTIVSWIFSYEWNHLMILRVIDLLASLVFSSLWINLLIKGSSNKITTVFIISIFLFTLNSPVFIQNGFRNSIFAAYIPLILAAKLILYPSKLNLNYSLAGVLTAIAILIREPLLLYALLFSAYTLAVYGKKNFHQYTSGCLAAGLIIIGTIGALRGNYWSLINSYKTSSSVFSAVAKQKHLLLIENSFIFLKEAYPIILLSIIALALLIYNIIKSRSFCSHGSKILWLLLATISLLEPIIKISSPYHFSFTILGLAGLVTTSWHELSFSTKSKYGFIFALISIIFFFSKLDSLNHQYKYSKSNLSKIHQKQWQDKTINQSNYLLAAEKINSLKKPGDTLSVSGFMYTLYPLTNLLPPSYKLSNLSEAVIQLGLNEDSLRSLIRKCPPTILVTTTREEWPGSDIISKVAESLINYKKVAIISEDKHKSYGNFGGTIYVNNRTKKCEI